MADKYTFLTDVTNTGISKDHGSLILKGDSVELNPNHASTKWLKYSKIVELQESEKDPSNSILDQNAQNAISIIESGVHSQEELEDLLAFEGENKKRSTVVAAINEAIELVKNPQE
jgi:hypothetical protein